MASLSVCKPMPPNEPLVNAIQLKRAVKNDKENQSCKDDEMDRIINDLKFDLNRPLKHFLQSVFKKGGRVVLAFPGSSYAQVSLFIVAYSSHVACWFVKGEGSC